MALARISLRKAGDGMDAEILSEEHMRTLFKQVCNWGRWGDKDELGALNFITPETRRAAAQLVTEGVTVSLARNFPTKPGPLNPYPAQHYMIRAGDECGCGDPANTQDFIGIQFHGYASTHVDALCHVAAEGKMYNDVPIEDVRSTGARRNSIMVMKDGVMGRGVLLDLPAALGVHKIKEGEKIGVAELEAAERAQDVRVQSGDLLLIRTGRDVRLEGEGKKPALANVHPEALPWFYEREIAVLGNDAVHDWAGGGRSNALFLTPIHTIGIVSIGLTLLDNLYLEDLAKMASKLRRWTFQLSFAPLRIEGGTGSPVNPIAVF
jgi:kynurenine formamidase